MILCFQFFLLLWPVHILNMKVRIIYIHRLKLLLPFPTLKTLELVCEKTLTHLGRVPSRQIFLAEAITLENCHYIVSRCASGTISHF